MNERIRELVKQAGGDFWQRLENDVVVKDAYITFDPPENLEKFAELIIRECMSLCEDLAFQYKGYRMEETDFGMKNIYAEGEGACDLLQHKMKEHFGVEE